MTKKTITAVIHKEEDIYVAECTEVATVSQGYTVEEAIANLKEAAELYLEEFPLEEISKPLLSSQNLLTLQKDIDRIKYDKRKTIMIPFMFNPTRRLKSDYKEN